MQIAHQVSEFPILLTLTDSNTRKIARKVENSNITEKMSSINTFHRCLCRSGWQS